MIPVELSLLPSAELIHTVIIPAWNQFLCVIECEGGSSNNHSGTITCSFFAVNSAAVIIYTDTLLTALLFMPGILLTAFANVSRYEYLCRIIQLR